MIAGGLRGNQSLLRIISNYAIIDSLTWKITPEVRVTDMIESENFTDLLILYRKKVEKTLAPSASRRLRLHTPKEIFGPVRRREHSIPYITATLFCIRAMLLGGCIVTYCT